MIAHCHPQEIKQLKKELSIPDTLNNLWNSDHLSRKGIHQAVHQGEMCGLKYQKQRHASTI